MGVIDGVLSVTPGWIGKLEVVEVEFDPKRISFADLVAKADACECAVKVFTRTDAQQTIAAAKVGTRAERSDAKVRVEDDKYYLSKTDLRFVPMTKLQAARVNARVGAKKAFEDLLSPLQVSFLESIPKHPERAKLESAIGEDFVKAWHARVARYAVRLK